MGTILKIALLIVIVIVLFITIRFGIKSNQKRKSLDSSSGVLGKDIDHDNVKLKNETIQANGKKIFLKGIPSWAAALTAFIITILPMFYIGESLTVGGGLGSIGVIILIIYYLILMISCFLIVRQNPKSFWYVPLICNALAIIAFTDSSIWQSSLWIFLGCGLVLSIIASIIGAVVGRKTIALNNSKT